MNKYALPLALVGAITLQACNQQSSASEAPAAKPAAPASVALEATQQRLSYGIAHDLGQSMLAENVPIDVDAFTAGLRDALEGGEPRMTQEEITAEMQAYQEKMAAEQQVVQAEMATANATAAAA
jgi:FKBP-type peptidyl-prolyl cis-trans isomerase